MQSKCVQANLVIWHKIDNFDFKIICFRNARNLFLFIETEIAGRKHF
jgi:uncharacterized protein YcsI (UPF0317 family)